MDHGGGVKRATYLFLDCAKNMDKNWNITVLFIIHVNFWPCVGGTLSRNLKVLANFGIIGASKKMVEDQPAAGSGASAVSGIQAQPKHVQLLTKRDKQQIYWNRGSISGKDLWDMLIIIASLA